MFCNLWELCEVGAQPQPYQLSDFPFQNAKLTLTTHTLPLKHGREHDLFSNGSSLCAIMVIQIVNMMNLGDKECNIWDTGLYLRQRPRFPAYPTCEFLKWTSALSCSAASLREARSPHRHNVVGIYLLCPVDDLCDPSFLSTHCQEYEV